MCILHVWIHSNLYLTVAKLTLHEKLFSVVQPKCPQCPQWTLIPRTWIVGDSPNRLEFWLERTVTGANGVTPASQQRKFNHQCLDLIHYTILHSSCLSVKMFRQNKYGIWKCHEFISAMNKWFETMIHSWIQSSFINDFIYGYNCIINMYIHFKKSLEILLVRSPQDCNLCKAGRCTGFDIISKVFNFWGKQRIQLEF